MEWPKRETSQVSRPFQNSTYYTHIKIQNNTTESLGSDNSSTVPTPLSQENDWIKKGLFAFVRDGTQIQLHCTYPQIFAGDYQFKLRVSYQECSMNRNTSALNIKRSGVELQRILTESFSWVSLVSLNKEQNRDFEHISATTHILADICLTIHNSLT